MGKSKKDKKEKSKKDRKEKRSSKDKRRKRDSSSSSSSSDSESDHDRKRQKSEKLAQKVVAHLQRAGGAAGADQPFVWAKKVEKEIGEGKKLKEISLFSDKNRQQERLDELDKVRKRQAEREAEKARREEELSLVQRMRAAQEAMESEAKEEEFYLNALLNKAERRLREGRAHASDLIARNLHAGLRLGEPADLDLKEPWTYFEGLQLDDAEALHHDIHEYAEYDKYEPMHVEFWKALLEVADVELAEARKRDEVDRAHLRGGAEAAAAVAAANAAAEQRLHPDVEAEIEAMLQGQTHGELVRMEGEVSAALSSGSGDPEYWEVVLKRLKVQKAKSHVREIQSRIVAATLQQLAQEAAEAADEMGLSDEDDEGDEGDEEGAEEGAKPARKPAAGSAVERAMGWGKEERGVVRAAGFEGEAAATAATAGPKNPEEIDLELDYGSDPEKEQEEGVGAGAADGAGPSHKPAAGSGEAGEGEEGEAGPSGVAGMGPAPAVIVYPSEVPGIGRRRPRRGQEAAADAVRRVGGEVEDLPEEIIADGSMSPPRVDPSKIQGEDVIHEEDDYRTLELLRQQVKLQTSARFQAARQRLDQAGPSNDDRTVRSLLRDSGRVGMHPMMRNLGAQDAEGGFRSGIAPGGGDIGSEESLAAFKSASLKAMGGDALDRDFGGEVPIEAQVYWWHDKYKPRKPKYFNRVHTGYEWSKYNQTHYDYDNPPPKVVQGYKFNILYHDLIDKLKAPQYVLEPDPQSTDNSTCIIRFIAGPPYEDIAFRIVRKEWNYARKHGFRCSFERGILHLFFNFKRNRYRR